MKAINALIVEDEVLIAETIKYYLNEKGHHVVGVAISCDEAVENIKKHKPDIVILDVRLYGDKSGIEVAKFLQSSTTGIPYIIVFAQFGNKFIDQTVSAGASGYLNKPIKKEKLWSTVELAVGKKILNTEADKYIDVKVSKGIQRIYLNKILYIKSDHVYVEIVCKDSKHYCRSSLTNILKMIKHSNFIRCHRSYIVNAGKIQKFSFNTVSVGHQIIPVSTKYKSSLIQFLQGQTRTKSSKEM